MSVLIFTAEQDEIIRLCAADGLSYTECGERLGKTRHSIAGRAFRLGIRFACRHERLEEIWAAARRRYADRRT